LLSSLSKVSIVISSTRLAPQSPRRFPQRWFWIRFVHADAYVAQFLQCLAYSHRPPEARLCHVADVGAPPGPMEMIAPVRSLRACSCLWHSW
jgi:hypothetical protein